MPKSPSSPASSSESPGRPGHPAPPLSEDARQRGRRIAISSHPLGMTFTMVFTQHLPTLALVSLGAGETALGLQSAMGATDLLRLPTLRAVGRFSKRSILIFGQLAALLGALPILFFPFLADLSGREPALAVTIAVSSLIAATASLKVSETVWFPLLRSYVEPNRIGRFFGTIRSGWHFALILYYLGARAWLDARPGEYGTLFTVAWLCGALRVFAIMRLPERSERTGERIRIREAAALIRESGPLRRYLVGVGLATAVRLSVVPFALVMLRREVGIGDGQILYTTVASFAGGLASLYLWGRIVDRIGPAPVFRFTALGMAGLTAALVLVEEPGPGTLGALVVFFFLHAVLTAGFGVADTHVLFGLAPAEAPTRTLVIAAVVVSVGASLAPLGSGILLEQMLASADSGLVVYHGYFAGAAILQAASFLPLRSFRR